MSGRLIRVLELLFAGFAASLAWLTACDRIAKAEPRPPLPSGYWRQGNFDVPCNATRPYIKWVNPQDGQLAFMRADASAMKVMPLPDGTDLGQDCGDHCQSYALDGMMVPLHGQPDTVYPAPYRDAPMPIGNQQFLCDVYRTLNGSGAKPCPSGETIEQYSNRMAGTATWRAGLAAYPQRFAQCAGTTPAPTQPPATPTAITRTATRVPTSGGCVGPGGVPCPSPTRIQTARPPTATRTSTSVPPTPAPDPTVALPSTRVPTAVPTPVATAPPPTASPTRVASGTPTPPANCWLCGCRSK